MQGGTYVRQKDGTLKLVEPVTADHADGNQARVKDDGPGPDAPTSTPPPTPSKTTKGGEK